MTTRLAVLLCTVLLLACMSDEDRLAQLRLEEALAYAQEYRSSRMVDSIGDLTPAETQLSQDSLDILEAKARADMLDAQNRLAIARARHPAPARVAASEPQKGALPQ